MTGLLYTRIKLWADIYGNGSVEDKRAVENFVDCETAEEVSALRTELYAMARGGYQDKTLDILLGQNRRMKYGTFSEWAKYMLLWMSERKA